jgi:hypothetical protein
MAVDRRCTFVGRQRVAASFSNRLTDINTPSVRADESCSWGPKLAIRPGHRERRVEAVLFQLDQKLQHLVLSAEYLLGKQTNMSMKATFALLLLFLLAAPCQAQVIFVNHAATGGNDGTSWEDAFVFLQDALAVAQSGEEVWVAEGVYRPDQGTGLLLTDRSNSFVIPDLVNLVGGFGGPTFQLNPTSHPTILSGDLLGDDDTTVSSDNPLRQDNSRSVLTCGLGGRIAISGFVISGGHGGGVHNRGGGLSCTGHMALEAHGLVFEDNFAKEGGGAYIASTVIPSRLAKLTFRHNHASDSGGGLVLEGSGDPLVRIDSSMFVGNSARIGGGGMMVRGRGGDVSRTEFRHNVAGQGGGLFIATGATSRIWSASFLGNSGVGTNTWGGAISLDENWDGVQTSSIVNSIFLANEADTGGGIHIYRSSLTIDASTFSFNTSVSGGQAIHHRARAGSNVKITNSIVWGGASRQVDLEDVDAGNPSQIETSLLAPGASPSLEVVGWHSGAPPLFEDALGPDGEPGTLDDGLALSPDSPAGGVGQVALLPPDVFDFDADGDSTEAVPHDFSGSSRTSPEGLLDIGALQSSMSTHSSALIPEHDQRLTLFPNPFGPQVRVQYRSAFHESDKLRLTVVDALGRRVSHAELEIPASGRGDWIISSSDWLPGLYLFRWSAGTATGSFIRMRQ